MNLTRKLEIAKTAIASITQHDAENHEVEEVIKEIQRFIAAELYRRGKRPNLLSRILRK